LFTAICSEGNPGTGPIITENVMYFYDEMKILDKHTYSEGWLLNFKEPAAEGAIHMEYSSD
jgi:hypothetical protein